jgi:hypothetical protein
MVDSPNNDPQKLEAVTCSSVSDCWTVGTYPSGTNGYDQLIIQHWNGTAWKIVKEGDTSRHEYLKGVTCASASECWAVGYSFDPFNGSGVDETLIEHWDGVSWSAVTSPDTNPAQDNVLSAVTCSSATECWAVGYYVDDNNSTQTLIQHWNGTAWTIVTSLNATPLGSNVLNDVTCTSMSQCWAVGYYSDPQGTLINR